MKKTEIINKISEIERGMARLPEGSIAKKKIKGKEYY